MAYDFEFFPEIKFVQSINSSNEYEITSEFYHDKDGVIICNEWE